MADGPAAPLSGVGEHRWELRKEALTMALYVAATARRWTMTSSSVGRGSAMSGG
jgi:hypothetical protein